MVCMRIGMMLMLVVVRMIVPVMMIMVVIIMVVVMLVPVVMLETMSMMMIMIMIVRMVPHHLERTGLGMGMERCPWQAVRPAERLVAARGVAVAAAGAVFQPAADPFDVMVMAFLRESDLGLEAEHLLAVLAHLAVHQVLPVEDFLHAVDEGVDDQRMVVEVAGLDELDLRDGAPRRYPCGRRCASPVRP